MLEIIGQRDVRIYYSGIRFCHETNLCLLVYTEGMLPSCLCGCSTFNMFSGAELIDPILVCAFSSCSIYDAYLPCRTSSENKRSHVTLSRDFRSCILSGVEQEQD